MINTLYFFLPMILLLGAVTTYSDIKEGKIRNKWIIAGLLYAIIVNIILFMWLSFTPGEVPRSEYFLELFLTFLFSLIVGYSMWHIGMWTAGDAKLFTVFSALLPLSVYTYGHVQNFSSFNILINTFVPFFVVYTVMMLTKTSVKQKIHYLVKSLQPRELFSVLLFLFAFSWLLQFVYPLFNIPSNYFLNIFLLFLILILLEKILSGKIIYFMVGISAIRLILDPNLFNFAMWITLGLTMLGFIFLRFFILYMGFDFMTKQVDVGLLKPGMVPAQMVYKDRDKYTRQNILHFSMLSYLKDSTWKRDYLFETAAEGLTKEDVKKLKNLKLGFEHLRIYNTLSFAPYLFGGVLLTLLFSGNMFISLVIYFS